MTSASQNKHTTITQTRTSNFTHHKSDKNHNTPLTHIYTPKHTTQDNINWIQQLQIHHTHWNTQNVTLAHIKQNTKCIHTTVVTTIMNTEKINRVIQATSPLFITSEASLIKARCSNSEQVNHHSFYHNYTTHHHSVPFVTGAWHLTFLHLSICAYTISGSGFVGEPFACGTTVRCLKG